jgi:hypothetical protein
MLAEEMMDSSKFRITTLMPGFSPYVRDVYTTSRPALPVTSLRRLAVSGEGELLMSCPDGERQQAESSRLFSGAGRNGPTVV